jgi:hypothetical protein
MKYFTPSVTNQQNSAPVKKVAYPLLLLILSLIFQSSLVAALPAEAKSLVNMNIDQAQEKLEALGYEICGVKSMKKTEDWINQSTKSCITLKFDKKINHITQVSSNPTYSDCLKGLDDVRKIWANCHDGQAPAGDARVNEERRKLEREGFKASYWVNDVSPGRTAEYWVNDASKKLKINYLGDHLWKMGDEQ